LATDKEIFAILDEFSIALLNENKKIITDLAKNGKIDISKLIQHK